MQKTASVFARIEPEIKERAEEILEVLGIPMSNAISLFLRQVIRHRGIPFEMKTTPLVTGSMGAAELNEELEKGYADILSGNLYSLENVVAEMHMNYGI